MYDCLVCGVVVRLLQRIGWLQCKICRGWTLDFGNSKFWPTDYEIGVAHAYQVEAEVPTDLSNFRALTTYSGTRGSFELPTSSSCFSSSVS